ncbi:ATP-grasp domain-containing protein [Peribacillus simplex]|uniref:ATP-grasp domain-containing protein n=1 Tax=Peribacillus simplex TaxID=1478 RepID=UPI003D28007E
MENQIKKHLLFIESNTTGTGLKAFGIAKNLGHRGLLLTKDFSQYSNFNFVENIVCDTDDINAIKKSIELIGIENICGITTTSEYYVEIAAEISTYYGFIGSSPEIIRRYRDKALLRSVLSDTNVVQPEYQIVEDITGSEDVLNEIKFPCVVKPTEDSGSNNVKLCKDKADVREHMKLILSKKTNMRGQLIKPKVLIEEYIEGKEYSVELFINKERITLIGITEKRTTGNPFFVECRHIFPSNFKKEESNIVYKTVAEAVGKLGYVNGALHAEIKMNKGKCVIIEINPRLAGGMIPELIKLSTGIDVLKYHINSFIDNDIFFEVNAERYAGIQFLISPFEGALDEIRGLEKINELKGFHYSNINLNKGSRVRKAQNSSDRLGYFIFQSKSYKEIHSMLDQLLDMIEIIEGEAASQI